MNAKHKLVTAALTGMSVLALAGGALAATQITIENSSNGRDTTNSAVVKLNRDVYVDQRNVTEVTNKVTQDADTGHNDVRDNLGGDIKVTTGDIDQVISILTEAGMNTAEVNDCGCDYNVEILNEKNGRDSQNTATFSATDSKEVYQNNRTEVDNKLSQDADTGHNDVQDNIDGDVKVTTGDVSQSADVATTADANRADVSGNGKSASQFALTNSMNGRESRNTVTAGVSRDTYVDQANRTGVSTDSDQSGDTGHNDVKDNQGDVSTQTGDVDQSASVDALVGSNALSADSCCEIEVTATNEKNSRESKNVLSLVLSTTDESGFFQTNRQAVDNRNDQDGNTGRNDVRDNNSDDITTGDVDSSVEIVTRAGENTIGDTGLSLDVGSDSHLSLLLLLLHLLLG